MDACPICTEPIDSGLHLLDRFPDGEPFLLCPSFEEFVLKGDVVMVTMPGGLSDGPGDWQAQGTGSTSED